MAAYVIGYSHRKTEVVKDLLFALQDPDDTVRGNAIRSLAAFAVLARLQPDSGLKISPTWFIEMLNSIFWTDRNNAAVSLVTLTDSRDPATLSQLRERALPSLIEMARMEAPGPRSAGLHPIRTRRGHTGKGAAGGVEQGRARERHQSSHRRTFKKAINAAGSSVMIASTPASMSRFHSSGEFGVQGITCSPAACAAFTCAAVTRL
jgi:hypothetical protein